MSAIGDDFRILWECEGGMGVVYVCKYRDTDRKYALKTIKNEFQLSQTFTEMFLNEARVWTSLGYHDNIVWAIRGEIINKRPFLILEYAGKWTLRAWIRHRGVSVMEVCDIASKVAQGMKHAQEKVPTIVHRDLKPENIILKVWKGIDILTKGLIGLLDKHRDEIATFEDEEAKLNYLAKAANQEVRERITNVKVTDFGLARAYELIDQSRDGTAPYMSPEQCAGHVLDGRSDIYSFGVILYELLTGHLPYEARSREGFFKCHQAEKPLPLKPILRGTPIQLGEIAMRSLAKDPDKRYQCFSDLHKDLCAIIEDSSNNKQTFTIYNFEGMAQTKVEQFISRAVTLITFGSIGEGLQYIDMALEIEPDKADILAEAASALAEVGSYKLALQFSDRALHLDPQNLSTLNTKAIALGYLGKPEDAMSCLDKILKINPESAKIWTNKGKILCDSMGAPARALECFEKALEIDGALLTAKLNRGNALRNLGRLEEAIKCWEDVLSEDPKNTRAMLRIGAILTDEFGQSEKALSLFRRAVELNQNDPEGWHNQGVALERLGQLDLAVHSYNKAITLDPSFVLSLFNRGCILARVGRFAEAAQSFDRVIQINPEDAEASRNRSICQSMMDSA